MEDFKNGYKTDEVFKSIFKTAVFFLSSTLSNKVRWFYVHPLDSSRRTETRIRGLQLLNSARWPGVIIIGIAR